jgi:hypothetical protein
VKVVNEEVRRTPKISLDFCNTNLNLLDLIRRELKYTLGIDGRLTSQKDKRPNRHIIYHLPIYRKNAIRKFMLHVAHDKAEARENAVCGKLVKKSRKER